MRSFFHITSALLVLAFLPLASSAEDQKTATPQPGIWEKLDQKVELQFEGTPLNEVADILTGRYGLNIILDRVTLDEEGISLDEPVTFKARDIALGTAIDLMLQQTPTPVRLRLVVMEEENYQLLTTVVKEEEHQITKVYPLQWLQGGFDLDDLCEVLETSVAPLTWEFVGGVGTISHFRGSLVIRQTSAVHREIQLLLEKLHEEPKQNADDQPNSFRMSEFPRAMQQETELQFVDTPLVDAMGIIGELHHLKIYLAEDVKVNSGKEPVTLFVSGVTLTTALDFILEPLKLDYIIKENLIVITEAKKADEYLTQEIYQVERLGIEIDEAADLIESVVETKSWKANGGQGVIRISNQRLVISQTERNHRKIESLLQNLDRNRSRYYVRRSMFGNAGNIPGFSSIKSAEAGSNLRGNSAANSGESATPNP